ncbi:MAG TPA: sulfite oxidase [Candidatus Limnocylindria bacterium]|nr:sulfite oxidase [Candidatus Limnocylindria bacterium]
MDERVIVTREPLNAETRLELQDGLITPAARHYVRSHFGFPDPPRHIAVSGAVRTARSISLDDLRALPARTAVVTLECAGNGRSFLRPPAPGEQWGLGAVGTAEWTGAPLHLLLEACGLSGATVEILFRGADTGVPADVGTRIAFERSLPLSRALAHDVLIAYAMNGAPIPREHGAPARLVVPTWYGMASVKWLAEIVAIERPFRGFYQTDRYVSGGTPLSATKPRAVIVAPLERVRAGAVTGVRGYAWSGQGAITRVQLSTDGGASWHDTRLDPPAAPAAWRQWHHEWTPSVGTFELLARATDASGEVQGLENKRDPLGYANNAAQPVRVEAR